MTHYEQYKERERQIEEAQRTAWLRKDDIAVGDRFLWHTNKIGTCNYATSGSLPKNYMPIEIDWKYESVILIVCKVYEGRNGYGEYQDYLLSEDGKYKTNAIGCINGIIISGVDAFKMERVI